MITKETAMDIALAYREIETAEVLLADVRKELERGGTPDIRDAFGRPTGGLQLGVPTGSSGHRLFNLPWTLCVPILEAHIAACRAKVALLTEKARSELGGAAAGAPDGP
jgi:hypothetical protein